MRTGRRPEPEPPTAIIGVGGPLRQASVRRFTNAGSLPPRWGKVGMGVKPAGGVNREVWMAEVGAYARGNGHVSSPLHQTRLSYSLIPEEPAMVDAAKHTHTSGMGDAFVAALAPKAHKRLGTDAGNALMFSLHTARRVERRVSASKLPDAALREIEAALRSWSRDFGAAARCLEEEHESPAEREARREARRAGRNPRQGRVGSRTPGGHLQAGASARRTHGRHGGGHAPRPCWAPRLRRHALRT